MRKCSSFGRGFFVSPPLSILCLEAADWIHTDLIRTLSRRIYSQCYLNIRKVAPGCLNSPLILQCTATGVVANGGAYQGQDKCNHSIFYFYLTSPLSLQNKNRHRNN
ncbi:hypothetical protein BDV18DRAFT_128244 [Aspergillus unguis]